MKQPDRGGNAYPIPRGGEADLEWAARLCIPSFLILLSTLLAGAGGTARAQSNDDEYRVKAAFLFHFAQLIDWPGDKLTVADNSLYLCTFREDPFQGALENTVAGKTIGNRVIRIRHLKQPQDLQGCHLVFLGKAQSKLIPMLLADLRNAPVLTVGETPDFLGAGGMICFHLEDGKVRFAINLTAAESAGIKIRSRLLVLAQNVIGESREK
jgi:YfiR/HmsC-like